MKKLEVEKKVKEIIAYQLELSGINMPDEARLVDDLRADSLAVVELALALEQEFKIEIPDEDLEGLRTVAQVVTYVQGKVCDVEPIG